MITLTRRPLSVSRALHVLSSCVLCLAPPAVDLLEALDRCVYTRRACCFCLRISHFCCFRCASSSGFARRRFPSVASGSKLLDLALIVRCCINDQLFLLCFGFIGANSNSNSMNSIRRAASSGCCGVAYAAEPSATPAVPP